MEAFGTRVRLYEEYYSFDVVKSVGARKGWIPPDKESGQARLTTDGGSGAS